MNKEDLEDAFNIIGAHLDYFENEYGYPKDNENLGKFKNFIELHFKGIKNLDEVIKIQKNNLTNDYMIGLYNGLVTAECVMEDKDNGGLMINCQEDNPPLKFEELKEDMWVWDNKYKTYYVIKKIGKGKSIFARYNRFVINEFTDELEEADCGWIGSFEENRFYRKEVRE